MKKLNYLLATMLALILSTGLAKANVGDVITSLDQLSNSKCYTIKAPRGALVMNTSGTAACSSHYSDGKSVLAAASTKAEDGQWAILTLNGNSYYLYNVGAGKFLQSDCSVSTKIGNVLTLQLASNPSGDYKFKITEGSNTLNNNNSGDYKLDAWSTENNGNRLLITEAGDFDASPFETPISFTYDYYYNGEKVLSEAKQTFAGSSYPALTPETINPGHILYTGGPTGTAQTTDEGKTFNITCTLDQANMPFEYSTSFANAKWYQLKIERSPAKYAKFDGTNISNSTTAPTAIDLEDMFAFVGTPFGFKIYNAMAGETSPLGPKSSTASLAISSSSNTNAATFVFEISSENNTYRIIRNIDNEEAYLNDMNNKLAYWYSTANRHDAGSNFTFIEIPTETANELLSKAVDVTYNVYLGTDLLYTKTITEKKNEAPLFSLDYYSAYLNIEGMPETITTSQTTYNIVTTYKDNFPIATDKWYNLAIGRSPNLQIYTETGVTNVIHTKNVAKTNDTWNNYLWRVEGDWYHGFRLYNKAAEAYVSYGTSASPANKTQAYLTTADEVGSYFEYMPNNNLHHFRIFGTANEAYISNNGGPTTTFLTNWNTSANLSDAGANIIITESYELNDDDITLFTEALEKANSIINTGSKVPVLYSSSDISTAQNALNNIECTKNSQVDAAIEQINSIMETFYKTAEGKKFSLRNNPDTYNLSATTSLIDATSTKLTAEGVFELKYSANGKYYLHGVYNNVYVNKPEAFNTAPTTSATATNDFYVSNKNGKENSIYMAFEMSGINSIHFSLSYANYTCGWTYNADNSQWTITEVTDAQYETLVASKNLENLIAKVQSYEIGTGYGEFTQPEGYADALAAAIELNNSGSATLEDINNAIAAIATNKLTLNIPANGALIRIKDNDGNYMTCNNNSSNSNRIEFSATKDDASIFCYTGSALVAYKTGLYASRSGNFPTNATSVVEESDDTRYQILQSGLTLGKYAISFGSNTRFMYTNANAGTFNSATQINNVGYEFALESVESVPVTISSAKMATLYSPQALEIPAGVTAYTGAYDNATNSIKLTALEGTIPANTGVVLEGEANTTYNFNIATSGEGTSCFGGTLPAISTTTGAYTLQVVDGQLGFYRYTGESLAGFKAFFTNSTGAKGFSLVKDDLTGINGVTNTTTDGVYYDLMGNIVKNPLKNHIYILNGTKVLK